MKEAHSAEQFGHDVLGPIIAEFCLRLWSTVSLMERPGNVTLLFCARGGLRLKLAYDRFLLSAGLSVPAVSTPFMVSRLVAMRASVAHCLGDNASPLGPLAETTLRYEFPGESASEVSVALTGVGPGDDALPRWREACGAADITNLLRHADGAAAADVLRRQNDLFGRHLFTQLDGRRRAVLVDTGLYGTTRSLLSEGFGEIAFSSALIARSHRPGPEDSGRSVGLSVDAAEYNPFRRRTALLRYWHLIEWLFEPALPSVRTFRLEDGRVVSNLEVDGWEDRVDPTPGSLFAGVLRYIDGIQMTSTDRIVSDADCAWTQFHMSIVWPTRADGEALQVSSRTQDFGLDGTWSQRDWTGPLRALRGSSMWREGEIARAATPWRVPLLVGIQTAYGMRSATRALRKRWNR